ncbi:MAG: Fe-S cluster assembly ATPase SufC [Candidatus Micrarchaeota archaeon]
MFEIENLSVCAAGRQIIKGLSLRMEDGEIHAVMGPNGAGKSTLAEALMGRPGLIVKGSVKLDGAELLGLAPDERAKKGLFLAFQNPEEIEGVKVSNLIRKATVAKEGGEGDLERLLKMHEGLIKDAEKLGLDKSFVSRDMNVGFSGGEKKRLEILQLIALKPKVAVLDEADSGLDVDGIRLIASAIKSLQDKKRCFLLITHYPRILKYLEPDYVHIIADGRIVKTGDKRLAHEVEEKGYSGYIGGKD